MDREKMVTDLQHGMSFATKFIPAIVKLKKAKDAKSGCWLSDDEVVGVIEALKILRSGPEVPARSEGA